MSWSDMVRFLGVGTEEIRIANQYANYELPWASQYEKQLASKDKRQGHERDTSGAYFQD